MARTEVSKGVEKVAKTVEVVGSSVGDAIEGMKTYLSSNLKGEEKDNLFRKVFENLSDGNKGFRDLYINGDEKKDQIVAEIMYFGIRAKVESEVMQARGSEAMETEGSKLMGILAGGSKKEIKELFPDFVEDRIIEKVRNEYVTNKDIQETLDKYDNKELSKQNLNKEITELIKLKETLSLEDLGEAEMVLARLREKMENAPEEAAEPTSEVTPKVTSDEALLEMFDGAGGDKETGKESDYKIVSLGEDFKEDLKIIEQSKDGNRAEYTTLNTCLIVREMGFEINGQVEKYLKNNPNLNLDKFEEEFLIRFMTISAGNHGEVDLSDKDVDNWREKETNRKAALTNMNSALFFRDALTPSMIPLKKDDVITEENIDEGTRSFMDEKFSALLIGSGNHATSILNMGGEFFYIDPFAKDNIIKLIDTQSVVNGIFNKLQEKGNFAVKVVLTEKKESGNEIVENRSSIVEKEKQAMEDQYKKDKAASDGRMGVEKKYSVEDERRIELVMYNHNCTREEAIEAIEKAEYLNAEEKASEMEKKQELDSSNSETNEGKTFEEIRTQIENEVRNKFDGEDRIRAEKMDIKKIEWQKEYDADPQVIKNIKKWINDHMYDELGYEDKIAETNKFLSSQGMSSVTKLNYINEKFVEVSSNGMLWVFKNENRRYMIPSGYQNNDIYFDIYDFQDVKGVSGNEKDLGNKRKLNTLTEVDDYNNIIKKGIILTESRGEVIEMQKNKRERLIQELTEEKLVKPVAFLVGDDKEKNPAKYAPSKVREIIEEYKKRNVVLNTLGALRAIYFDSIKKE